MAASTSDLFRKTGAGTVTTLAAPGKALSATSITVGATTNDPTDTGIVIAIRVVDSAGELIAGTYTEWSATVTSGTTFGINAVPVYGSDQVYPAGSTTQVYIPLSSYAHNELIDGILTEHNQDGTHSDITATSVTADEFIVTGTAGAGSGWLPGLPTPDTVTNNGNRSYDLVFNSTDLTDTVSNGMRLKCTREVTAPTYMGGAFNGTNHYFTKVTPTGTLSTVTNNFTIIGYAEPTAYAVGVLAGRGDATPANGIILEMQASGVVRLILRNGGASNYRYVETYQSLPLNKKTHVAASWTSGTVVIYFDGVSVPVTAAVTSGTAPTTAGTGGDFSIGRYGAYSASYFTGYLSGFGVFDAVLSAATIKSLSGQVLSGSETNCIGAWSLDNVATDANAAANNLTATGGVGYTARSPYGTQADGTTAGTTEYAIITKTAFSTNTTLTVQVPEGCALPTSGGISAVSYSTQKAPYGFPADSNRWRVVCVDNVQYNATSSATYIALNSGALSLTVPVGAWDVGWQGDMFNTSATTVTFNLSSTSLTGMTAAAGAAVARLGARALFAGGTGGSQARVIQPQSLTAAATYIMYNIGASAASGIAPEASTTELFANFALL